MKNPIDCLSLSFLLLITAFLAVPSASASAPDEIRALWAQGWVADLHSPAGIDKLIADARAANFNTLFVQMRRRADTLYFSDIDPRISSGVPGFSNFDALEYILQKAREQSPPLEIHAWIVVYPVDRATSDPKHVTNAHPEWMTQRETGEIIQRLDPGHPGVQQYLLDVAMELITKYDIDGLHYDYVRYETNVEGYNPVSVQRFQKLHNRIDFPAPDDPEWSEFRRNQVTDLVRNIYLHAMAVRPEVKISAATITWSPGPHNLDGFPSTRPYYDILSNWPAWMEEGIIDLNVPMAYFRHSNHVQRADYTRWNNFIKDTRFNRHAAIGPAIYLNELPASITQMRETRDLNPRGNRADGVAAYTYHQVSSDLSVPFSEFRKALTEPSPYDPISPPLFAEPAAIPEMPWKTNPTTGHLMGYVFDPETDEIIDGALIHLSGSESRTIRSDGTGFYGFVDLPPGEYSVSIEWQNESSVSQSATISIGNVTELDLIFELAPKTTGNLEGTIRDAATGEPLEGVAIHLSGPVTQTIAGHPNGTYQFTHLPPGNYTVQAGLDEIDETVPGTKISIQIGETTVQDLHILIDPIFIPGEAIVVDDLDPEATFIGPDWRQGTSATTGYAGGYHFTHNPSHPEYQGYHSAIFSPNLPESGFYRIDTRYPAGSNRSPDATYTISDGAGTEFGVTVNQTTNDGQWVTITRHIFLEPDNSPFVRIDNNGSGAVTMADAIRWVALEPVDPEHEISITTIGEGRIEGLPESKRVLHGNTLELEAIGESGFVFSHWSGKNAWGNENPWLTSIVADLEITAVFFSPWLEWLETHFSEEERADPEITSPDADPLGSGISNLLSFAFGIDPLAPDSTMMPAIAADETGALFTFRRMADEIGFDYILESSTNLIDWNRVTHPVEEVSVETNGDGTEKVTLRVRTENESRFFLRLRIGEK
ncbi:MAG TPA: family 10 glycosylhydrolase [Opitutales bacterium]|nr:family 10 glycosylhydrolase [Opitutales bacterium]